MSQAQNINSSDTENDESESLLESDDDQHLPIRNLGYTDSDDSFHHHSNTYSDNHIYLGDFFF